MPRTPLLARQHTEAHEAAKAALAIYCELRNIAATLSPQNNGELEMETYLTARDRADDAYGDWISAVEEASRLLGLLAR